MAATHKGAISFGLVHIPVALHTATQDNDIHFNQICKEDGSRVKYKKVCASCGKEVATKDIIKGFEFAPGQYVTMTDADFEKAKTKKDKTIQILHFTDLTNIRPIYFDKTYHAVVEAGGDKAYELLRQAMLDEEKVAIAKTVMGQSEKLLCLIPTEKGILVETLFGLYSIKGSINVQLGEKTGFSEEDAEKLKEALRTLFINDASSARPDGSMEVISLYWWEHNNKIGQYSAAKVHNSVKALLKDGVLIPTSVEDYDIIVDKLPGLKVEIIEGM